VRSLRTAVVGYGRWGRVLAGAINAHPRFDVVRICHRSAPTTARMTPRLDEILRDGTIQTIVIATPLATRAPIVLSCLEAGKHVMTEKPLAASSQEATELVKCAHRNNRILFTNYVHAYGRSMERLQGELAALGSLRAIDISLLQPGPLVEGEGVETLLGSHAAAILFHLLAAANVRPRFKDILSIKGPREGSCYRWSWQGVSEGKLNVGFTVDLSHPVLHRRVDLIGNLAVASADLPLGVVRRLDFDSLKRRARAVPLTAKMQGGDDLSRVLDHFAASISNWNRANEILALEVQAFLGKRL
jgi:hypothetical protein